MRADIDGNPEFSLAVCFPVWNRADLFKASFDSLIRQLGGIDAGIWIFDNGSDAQTRALIESLKSDAHRLVKVSLPQNMGIPFAVNIFSQMLTQDCDYAGYRAPDHVMISDADAYFKKPVRDMLEILEANSAAAIISGHDSVEHETFGEYQHLLRDRPVPVKEKKVERGLCLMMRKAVLAACVPFPHDSGQDVDWQLMTLHANSIAARGRKLLAVDYVVHIGLYDSTWHPVGAPADQAEVIEINRVLAQEGLLSPERRTKMAEYCRASGLQAAQAF